MAQTRLQDDLLQEFREEKRMVNAQIDLFDPLGVSLRRPAAQRLAGKSMIILGELICWLAIPALGVLAFFLPKLFPTNILFQLNREEFASKLGAQNIQWLHWNIYGFIAVMALLFLLLARALRKIRLKNDVLNIAGRSIKSLVGQHLERKAAIDAIEQRHFTELPSAPMDSVVVVKPNEIANPGWDGAGSL